MPANAMRKSEEETMSFLEHLPIFLSLNVDELSTLARHMSYIHLQRGEYLFVEGDPGTFLGFVVNGILEVQKRRESGDYVTLARLTKGASIGEMALIDKSPRSATVIARQAATLVTLADRAFDLLAERHPPLGIKVIRKIARLLSLNMRRTSSRLADLIQAP